MTHFVSINILGKSSQNISGLNLSKAGYAQMEDITIYEWDGTCIRGTGVMIPMNETNGGHKRTRPRREVAIKRSKVAVHERSTDRGYHGVSSSYLAQAIRLAQYSKSSTPKLVEAQIKNPLKEVQSLFPGARKFTPEEAIEYKIALNQVYKPTGRNRFKL